MTKKVENTPKPKAQKARVKRILQKKDPQVFEFTKKVLILKGNRASQDVQDVMKDIASLVKPNCKVLSHNNDILPFEDASSLEFLTSKNDCSLFLLGSHSKKRPNNLVMGRTYDGHILDLVEFGVEDFEALNSFPGFKKGSGSKPMLTFLGDQWSSDVVYGRIQNLFIDFFRGDRPEKVALKGLDHVLSFTCQNGEIFIRAYTTRFMKSGGKSPNVELNEMGPFMKLNLRRHQIASDDLWKLSLKKPKAAKTAKVKNVSRTSLGDKVGRLHVGKQDIDGMGGKRMPVLRKRNPENDISDAVAKRKKTA